MGHDLLTGFGERFYLSTVDGHLARALRSLGRAVEAFELTVASERNADDEDVDVQMRWRSVRARILADRGQVAEALALGDEIAEFLEGQEFVTVLCEALGDRAEIAVVAGRPDDALTALDQVIDLCRQKGNRALLAITEARRTEIAIGR
jgi:ATP/maltotriose-dependent transcriptional regulator MalT